MTPFLLSQILVGMAICTDLLSFQGKGRKHILVCLIISSSLISLHFVLLEHWTAAGLGLLAGIRFVTSYFTTSKKAMSVFVCCSLLIGIVTYSGVLSLLSCTGAICNTVGSFCSTDRRMRKIMFLGTCFWLTHNILAHSPTAVLLECLFLSSNIVGYYRYYVVRPAQTGTFSH
ncbi:YgjV family protein [Desulfogranum marinum]|uniref:YgjV family protein n=1 Tax=Desulfogranum marinum TaxID=453220 RepID=UPI001964E2C9|nr:YgjV family protein [Desulfogranum marinum]MBM9512425.1 YgjV family protein [Desulfogranum marinum]